MNARVLTHAKPSATPAPPVRSNLLQRNCACGGSAGPSGECEECSKKKLLPQTKFPINQQGDIYEQEADRIADQVMVTAGYSGESGARPLIQRFSRQANGQADSARADVNEALVSPGRPLEPALLHEMEQRFGHDFSQVRVHTDEKAAAATSRVNAVAYTVGRNVVFGAGRYSPTTSDGKRLLAHELTHVVQQTARRAHSCPGLQRKEATGLSTKVVAHGASADAVKIAQARMNEILGSLKDPSAGELKGATVELHIIPQDKKLTDLPEFASLKGTKTFDGRSYDELRGVGATKVGDKITYAIAEEQLVPVKEKPSAYKLGFVGAHESGHVVEQFGLTKDQKKALQDAYDERKKGKGPWLSPDWYTSSGTGEYFAQSTSAYFGRAYSDSEEDKKTYTREWLKKNDPAMTKLLASVYG
jgi:hypothetical protein